MTSDSKERIRQLADLAEVIGESVVLKPAGGGRLKGLCPFHNEKTPSFHVHRDKGFYYCFGCQAKGDVFDFVMQTQGLGFADALRSLGARFGVEVERFEPSQDRGGDLYRVNELAQEYFRSHLEGAASAYLSGRGLSTESVERFGLGFAPAGWDGLLRFAATRGVQADALSRAGLVATNDNGRTYDRFRGRVMFPIRDALGRLVGFAGRALGDDGPKYLNTPETDIFHKGEVLYGLQLARQSIRRQGECIVVEGYMDVIALHQTGFDNTVAALGTALTAEHADALSRLEVLRLQLAFDADEAGQRAILAGLDRSVGRQFLVSAVRLPADRDPADVVLNGDPRDFKAALATGMSEVEFRFLSTVSRYDTRTDSGRQAVLNELLPSLRPRAIMDPVASELQRLVVDRLGVDEGVLQQMVRASRTGRVDSVQARGLLRGGDLVRQLELEIIALFLQEQDVLEKRLAELHGSVPERPDSILAEFHAFAVESGFSLPRILDHFREREGFELVFERLLAADGEDGPRRDMPLQIENALSRLRELELNAQSRAMRGQILQRISEVSERISAGEVAGGQLDECYRELSELEALLAARDAERRLRNQRR